MFAFSRTLGGLEASAADPRRPKSALIPNITRLVLKPKTDRLVYLLNETIAFGYAVLRVVLIEAADEPGHFLAKLPHG